MNMNRFHRSMAYRGVVALAALVLALGYTMPLNGRDASGRPRPNAARRTSPFNLGATPTFLLNFNEWLCGLHQIGEVCTSAVGSSVGGGGFWPAGTANQYIFNSGLQVAAVIGSDGGAWANDTVATFFFNASGPGHGNPLTGIYSSADPADLEAWPEDCYIDSPVFGRVKSLSQIDTCVQYWDGDPTATFPGSHPIGILVTQHSLLWNFPNNKDIMFFIYRFTNATNRPEFRARNPQAPAGGYTLSEVYAAFAADNDVSGHQYSENFATVVPELNLGATWQYDFETDDYVPYAPNFDAAPGFVGMKFLKSPVNTGTAPVTVRIGNQTRVVQPGEELGVTFFSVFTNPGSAAPMPDADDAKQAYRYLSGKLLASEKADWCPDAPPGMCYVKLTGPADMRQYQSSGPFSLAPGESAEIVVAYVAGAPVPGTYVKGVVTPVGDVTDPNRQIEKIMGRGYNRPGFPSLFANAKIAQGIYDANFVLPSAPRSPTVTVLPGNKQNTVLWSADPVTAEDPFGQLATDPTNALYDPNFRSQDFEGFRVYRRSNPSAEWKLIAQFDQLNGIDEVITDQEKVITADGTEVVVKADTARVCRPEDAGCAAETGLKFSIVDRGGDLPNPASGPGLTNGLRYYYTVTSFDINSPQSGPNSLESTRRLSKNAQDLAGASAVPKSLSANVSAGSYSVKMLGSDGSTLNPDAPVPALDPETGNFAGPMPPTDGFKTVIDFLPEVVTQEAKATITIDSVTPGNPRNGIPLTYYVTAETPAGTQKLTVPLTIGYTDFDDNSVTAAYTVVTADETFESRYGVKAAGVSVGGSSTITVPGAWAGTAVLRGWVNGATSAPTNGPVWFVSGQSPVADPTAGLGEWWCGNDLGCSAVDKKLAGDIPGYTIVPMKGYGNITSRLRTMEAMLSTVRRAADIEITWGDNGKPSKVYDLTHKVDVPFSVAYRASYGFLTLESFTGVTGTADGNLGVISVSDWGCVSPAAEMHISGAADFATSNCRATPAAKLQDAAKIVPISYSVGAHTGTGSPQNGFAMYLNGEMLFFFGPLPTSGSKWVMRTFTGGIDADAITDAGGLTTDYNNYEFSPTSRPPAVPGLKVEVALVPTSIDLTTADLSKVHTVPDPYYVTHKLETSAVEKKLLFVNLPPQATIRIYSLSGVLVHAITHNDPAGGGTVEWDLRNRNNQFVASGVYFYHVETPTGAEKIGKFTVVQYAQ